MPRPKRPARAAGPPGWVFAVFAALYALVVPWYGPLLGARAVLLGLPAWVLASLLASASVAAFTVYVLGHHWPDPDAEGEPPPGSRKR